MGSFGAALARLFTPLQLLLLMVLITAVCAYAVAAQNTLLLVPGLMVLFFLLVAFITRLLVDAPGQLWRWLRWRRYEAWQGRYFAYESRQVRIYWDAETLWVNADDVFAAMNEAPDAIARRKLAARFGQGSMATLPGLNEACLSESALPRYLNGLRHDEAYKFRRWFEREVFPNVRRLRELDSEHYEKHELTTPDSPSEH